MVFLELKEAPDAEGKKPNQTQQPNKEKNPQETYPGLTFSYDFRELIYAIVTACKSVFAYMHGYESPCVSFLHQIMETSCPLPKIQSTCLSGNLYVRNEHRSSTWHGLEKESHTGGRPLANILQS